MVRLVGEERARKFSGARHAEWGRTPFVVHTRSSGLARRPSNQDRVGTLLSNQQLSTAQLIVLINGRAVDISAIGRGVTASGHRYVGLL